MRWWRHGAGCGSLPLVATGRGLFLAALWPQKLIKCIVFRSMWVQMGAILGSIYVKIERRSNFALIFAYRCVFGLNFEPTFEHL